MQLYHLLMQYSICTKHAYQGEVIQLLLVGGGEFHASTSHTSSSDKLSFLSQDLGKEDSAHDVGVAQHNHKREEMIKKEARRKMNTQKESKQGKEDEIKREKDNVKITSCESLNFWEQSGCFGKLLRQEEDAHKATIWRLQRHKEKPKQHREHIKNLLSWKQSGCFEKLLS